MRDSWTDERLDDFRGEVNRRFDKVDRRFDEVNGRFDKVDDEMNRRFDEAGGEMKQLRSTMDSMQRTMVLTGGGIIAALIGVIGTQL